MFLYIHLKNHSNFIKWLKMSFTYEYKQVIVVRTDIRMSKGKLAAQVAHAAVSSFYRTLKEKPEYARRWLDDKQPKVVLKASSLEELYKIKKEVEEKGIVNELIQDAGLTELPPRTITCLGIGPAPKDLIDEVTGELPLV